MALITCEDVSFAYENTPVISGLNFAVEKGDYICVVGENGSGKSTLIRGLVHLKAPASGSITLGEDDKLNIDRTYCPECHMPCAAACPSQAFQRVPATSPYLPRRPEGHA